MRAQLGKFVDASHRELTTVQVLAFDSDTDPDLIGSFQTLDIGDPPILSAVLIDHLTGRWILEDDSDISGYRAKFDRLCTAALSESESRALIQRIVSEL